MEWDRILPLEVAAFSVSDEEPTYLDMHRANIGHENSALRIRVLESLALVAPELSFDDEEMRERVSYSLSTSHVYCEWGAVLLLVTEGSEKSKRMELERWLREYELNSHERELLEHISQHGYCKNHFFLRHFFQVANYMAFRLAMVPHNIRHADEVQDAGRIGFPDNFWAVSSEIYWFRVNNHPLMEPFIKIFDNKTNMPKSGKDSVA